MRHLSLSIIYDWIITIIGDSKHKFSTINMYSLKKKNKTVILHPYLSITTTSPQRPLSSVPKVAVVERFDCLKDTLPNLQFHAISVSQEKEPRAGFIRRGVVSHNIHVIRAMDASQS